MPQHRAKHTALAFLLGALLTGGALGFTAARMFDRESRVPRSYETMREQLARTLDLSAEQKARFDEIIDRRDHKLDSVMAPLDAQLDSLRPHAKAIRESARLELRAVLSAAQQRAFDKYVEEMRARASRDSMDAARRRGATPQAPATASPAAAAPRTE